MELMHIPRAAVKMPRVYGVRANSDPNKILAELTKAFEEFKVENDTKLKTKADVVLSEKVDRINASVGELQKALDDANARLAAVAINGNGKASASPEAAAYRSAFGAYFRKGNEAGLADLAVKAALNTQSDPDGGYVTPIEMETAIDRVLGTVSAMRSLAMVRQIGTKTYTKEVNMGTAGSGWVGEEDARPETSTPKLRQLEFVVQEIYAEPYATQVLLDDARIDIEAWLADEVSIAFAEQEGAAAITGNGVKRLRGILSYENVANGSYSWGKVGYVPTGAANGFDTGAGKFPADVFVDAYHALKQGYRGGSTWLMSDVTLAAARKFKDGDGNYLWAPPSAAEGPSTILGRPVVTDDNMPSPNTNTFPVAFADFRRAYLLVDRTGIRVLRNPYKVNGKVAFYTTKRVGGGIQNFEAIKLIKCATS